MQRKIEWVSHARLAPYLAQTSGDEDLAWELYELNAAVSAALSEVIHHVEVLLRNSMMRELEQIHPLAFPWTLPNNDSIGAVAERMTNNKRKIAPTEDDVTSQLNLGFWTSLVNSKDFRVAKLWDEHLHRVFPGQPDRLLVAQALEDLKELRNRCSHQDSLLRFHPEVEMRKIERLTGWIDEDAVKWVHRLSRVTEVMRNRPHVESESDTAILPSTRNRSASPGKRFKYPLFDCYHQKAAVILEQSSHIGQEISHLGFYLPRYDADLNGNQSTFCSTQSRPHIPQIFPQIENIIVPAEWSREEANRLANGDQRDKKVAAAMRYGIGNGYDTGGRYVIYLLSPKDDLRTHKTPAEILHLGSGQWPSGWPFIKYARLDLVNRARQTTDLI